MLDLIGRQTEASQLGRVLAEDGERVVVVRGEPGVGKTALIEQTRARAIADGWQVVGITGVQAEEVFTLGGLNQLVLSLREFHRGLTEVDRAALAPVFGADPSSEVAVLPVVAALLNLFTVAADAQPLLLAVDDVQWLDSVSAEVLSAAGRRLTHPGVRIVAGLRAPYQSVFSSAGWGTLEVTPLDAEDAGRLLERSGVTLSEATRTAVLAAASGNPLALAELPRLADRTGLSSAALPLTDRLVAAFADRLQQLEPTVRAELLRAALDGSTGNTTSATRSRYVLQNVQPAVAAGLVVQDSLGAFVLRHPLVSAAIIHQASPQERCDAHRDLAVLYDDVLVRRASHLAAAATEPDQEVADLLSKAARLSGRRGGLSVAAEWLRRAAELSSDQHRRAEMLGEAVFIAARAGRLTEAQDVIAHIGDDERDSALAVLADSYRAFHADGEVVFTHRRLVDALDRAELLDDRTVNRLANLLLSITNFAGDAHHRERTNTALRALETRLNPAVLMYQLGRDDIVRTARAVRSMISQYAEWLPRMTAPQVILLSFPAYCVDAMTDFRAPLRQAFDQLSEHGASIDVIEGGRVVVLDLIAAGHWKQAEQVGAKCLEMSQQPQGSELVHHELLADLGLLAACRGDLETARRYADEVTAWSKPRGLHLLLDITQRIAVRVALAEADYETAYQSAIRISPPGQFPPHNVEVGQDMLDLVTAAVLSGRMAEASAHAAAAVDMRLDEFSPRVAALTTAASAMTAPDTEADGLYRAATAHPGIAEFPFDRARILLAHGMWLRRARRIAEARTVLASAAADFDRLGARPWGVRARAELQATGAIGKQSPGGAVALSMQERRIAELAAAGKTSKEIATQLSLSPRTIDTHLIRAFRKLGITKRSAISQALIHYDSAV